jgi:hypothetical protein
MEILDWIVLSTTLFFIVVYGALKTKGSATVKDYLLDNNEKVNFNFTTFATDEHDQFHFELWDKSWNKPKPFYMVWYDILNYNL